MFGYNYFGAYGFGAFWEQGAPVGPNTYVVFGVADVLTGDVYAIDLSRDVRVLPVPAAIQAELIEADV